jgi:hypothetical protein
MPAELAGPLYARDNGHMGPNQALLLMAAGIYIPLIIALIRRKKSCMDMVLLCLMILLPSLVANGFYPSSGTVAFGVIHCAMLVGLGISVIRWAFGGDGSDRNSD